MTDTAPAGIQNHWLQPLTTALLPSVSERLIRALEAHIAAEGRGIADCQQLAQRSTDPVVRMLMALIVEDEHRHHALLRSMADRMRDEVEFVPSETTLPVPSDADSENAPVDAQMAIVVRSLIRDEHESARHVRHLARQDPLLYGGMYPLLLETIARDSEKHAAILRYVLRRIEDRLPPKPDAH
jgi:rubrerythrin